MGYALTRVHCGWLLITQCWCNDIVMDPDQGLVFVFRYCRSFPTLTLFVALILRMHTSSHSLNYTTRAPHRWEVQESPPNCSLAENIFEIWWIIFTVSVMELERLQVKYPLKRSLTSLQYSAFPCPAPLCQWFWGCVYGLSKLCTLLSCYSEDI